MKKSIAVLFTLSVLFSCFVAFAGCKGDHEHEFGQNWASDATYHWHACAVEGCGETKDKSEHVWQDIIIPGKATITDDGRLIVDQVEVSGDDTGEFNFSTNISENIFDGCGKRALMCKECNYFKENDEPYTGVSLLEWNTMLSIFNSSDYTLKSTSKMTITYLSDGSQTTVVSNETMKFDDGNLSSSFVSEIDGVESTGEKLYEGEESALIKALWAETLAALKYEYFTFDVDTDQYVANKAIEVPVINTYYDSDGKENHQAATQVWENVVVKISNGMLKTLSFTTTVLSEELGTHVDYENVYTFSDYEIFTING